jgi:hypothetical protein
VPQASRGHRAGLARATTLPLTKTAAATIIIANDERRGDRWPVSPQRWGGPLLIRDTSVPGMPPGYGTFKQAEKAEQQAQQDELGL